jgi:uncharacterized damage-inducible protein DinB
MDLLTHIQRMGTYNHWMNQKLYAACSQITPAELHRDRQAFFGSIFGTLSHLLVADIVWLKRFAAHPRQFPALEPLGRIDPPIALNQILHNDYGELHRDRDNLDNIILAWVNTLQSGDLEAILDYQNMKGVPAQRPIGALLCHFFNHQTHHRGQLSVLLSQAGQDIGVTDLLEIIPQSALT